MSKTGSLNWHLRHRSDGCVEEYATDDAGRPRFLIERGVGDSWVLYQSYSFKVETLNIERIDWTPVWSFDSPKEARKEAEIRYANESVYTLRQ